MELGICKLCLQMEPLKRSHLMPAAMYKYARTQEAENPNTIVVDRRGRAPVVKQATARLLCSECEDRFSRLGENWVMSQIWNGTRFPLLERLDLAVETRRTDDALIYSGSAVGIDTEKLAYFAVSVLWRAGVHQWTTSKDSRYRLDLGMHEELLRRYLLGEIGFPAKLSVMVTVCSDVYSRAFHMPTAATFPIPGVTAFAMLALGVQFLIFLGPTAPDQICCVQSPLKLISKRDCGRKTIEAFAQLNSLLATNP